MQRSRPPPSLAVLFLLLPLLVLLHSAQAARYRGTWRTTEERVRVVAKFGFQQTLGSDQKGSRGFVFGNITSGGYTNSSRPVLFALVPESHFRFFEAQQHGEYLAPCSRIMQNLSSVGFESRCFKDGARGDIFRWVPCPSGKLCRDEDDPTVVLPGSQLTFQVEEPKTPEYWYALLISCDLDKSCAWVRSSTDIYVDYDIHFTNGNPTSSTARLFELQFSVDEQNTVEMYLSTFLIYIVFCGLLWRAKQLYKMKHFPPRLRLLTLIIGLKTVGFGLESVNLLIFAADGEGIFIFRFLGEILRTTGVDTMCLLLILLARGWGVRVEERKAASGLALTLWAALAALHHLFFLCNIVQSYKAKAKRMRSASGLFVYDLPHQVDVFHSWPGYGMLSVRIIFALWFLFEVRRIIASEKNDERATFLAHFGAGFLVWFVYLLGLGVVASFISDAWRFKLILAIRSLANASAIAVLIHLFWPTSSNRKFFHDSLQSGRLRLDSEELHDMERLLFEDSDEECEGDRLPLHGI